MAERHLLDSTEPAEPSRRTRRGPDAFTLIMALITLGGAAMTLLDWQPPIPLFDPRWLLAGAAVLVGVLLLLASVRPARRQHRNR